MKGWILAKKNIWDEYEIHRFLEEAIRENIEISLYDPKDFEFQITDEIEKKLFYQGCGISLPDFVLPKTGPGIGYYYIAFLRHMEHLGVPTINSSEAISVARDKLKTLETLACNDIPTPKTMLASFPLNFDFIVKEFQFPLIIKPIVGGRGKGVILCETAYQMKDLMEMLEISKKDNTYYVFQEFISFSKGRDIRVVVVGGRALGAMIRKAPGGYFKANISQGGKGEPFELNSELEWLSTESARILGLDVAGVDILFDRSSFKVCEVNSCPGFMGFEKAMKVNIPQQIYKYIQIRLEVITFPHLHPTLLNKG